MESSNNPSTDRNGPAMPALKSSGASSSKNPSSGRNGAAFRPKVKVKTGCLKCRSRRKKCDEKKPRCDNCARLNFVCSWPTDGKARTARFSNQEALFMSARHRIIQTFKYDRAYMRLSPRTEQIIQSWVSAEESGIPSAHIILPDLDKLLAAGLHETVPSVAPVISPASKIRDQLSVVPNPLTESPEQAMIDNGKDSVFRVTLPVWQRIENDFAGICPEEELIDQHILICIVLYGFQAPKGQALWGSLWDCFEEIYTSLLLSRRPQKELLALLDHNWRMIKIFASQRIKSGYFGELLPKHMNIRPLEIYLPSPQNPARKCFPWPGVRDHLALTPKRYRGDNFIAAVYTEFRFIFPSFEDAFYFNPATGLFAFTPAFMERRDNLGAWTMTSDFFALFPEMVDDIPMFNHNPTAMRPSGTASGIVGAHVPEEKEKNGISCEEYVELDGSLRAPFTTTVPGTRFYPRLTG